jgi:hypothetical protein
MNIRHAAFVLSFSILKNNACWCGLGLVEINHKCNRLFLELFKSFQSIIIEFSINLE